MSKVLPVVILAISAILIVVPTTAQTFDNSGGGSWTEAMSFPVTTTPSEHTQYIIQINGTTWEIYNTSGGLEVSGTNNNFWSLVQSDGDDIRVYDQNYNQLYFWVEYFNSTEQKAKIWVRLEAGCTKLSVAYGNSLASPSTYNNRDAVFELTLGEEDGDISDWSVNGGTWSVTSADKVEGNYAVEQSSASTSGELIYNVSLTRDIVIEVWSKNFEGAGIQSATVYVADDSDNGYRIDFAYDIATYGWLIWRLDAGSGTSISDNKSNPLGYNVWGKLKVIIKSDGTIRRIAYNASGNVLVDDTVTDNTYSNFTKIKLGVSKQTRFDDLRIYKLADPTNFESPIIEVFQKKFGTKTVYVNVTYLDTGTTDRYNPPAYYHLEDKPQINVTSTLSISGVNATVGANISIELIEFVTLDKVIYNGTDVTASLTSQGTVTNTTTGLTYNVYNFTTYENGTLEIYGHISNKAYEATFKLDGETVDVFNVTAVVGEVLEITLPHRGNVTLASIEHTGVTSVLINTKDVGVGAKTLTITIEDPENFTIGYIHRTVNIDWGKVYFNITDLQNKTLARTTYGFFNKNFSISSTDPTKLYAGDIEIDVYFHGVKLKSVEIYLNHTNNGLTMNVSVNATQFKDYRNVTRIIASPNYFEVVNLSAKYPFSVMKLVNASGTIVIDFVSNAPTSVKVEGATSYTYEKPVLKITANGNVTITDLYKLTVPLKDRLGNKVNFYILINGSRVDASAGKASKLLKPSWYEVKVPITVSGFELWKFNDSSNIALVEINASDKTLPTAEYRVPSKIVTKEVRIQTKFPWLPFPFPFLSESKPAQEETPIVRLQGSLRDFYNAPVPNKTIVIKVASPNFTRVYNVTTDSSGNFKIDVDMAEGIEYKVSYKFAGDDVYVSSSTTKTFTIEQLLPAPPEEMTFAELLIFIGIVVGLVAVVAGAIYLARRTKAKTLARMESEFRFFRRLK